MSMQFASIVNLRKPRFFFGTENLPIKPVNRRSFCLQKMLSCLQKAMKSIQPG